MSEKVIFFGNERLATGVTTSTPTLQALINAGYTIPFIVINQSENTQGRKNRELEVATFAADNDIELYVFESNEALIAKIKASGSQVAVLAAFGRIIKQEVLDAFPLGIINIHPSLLPKYRGTTPLETFITSGDSKTGVSIMKLGAGMDDGDIFSQTEVMPQNNISKQALADQLLEIGAQEVVRILPAIINQSIQPEAQVGEPSLTKQIQKQDGLLDFTKSATQLEREIRAFANWPTSYTSYKDKRIVVTSCSMLNRQGDAGTFFVHEKQLAVYCGEGALLITHLQPEGKKEMASRDFLLGHSL